MERVGAGARPPLRFGDQELTVHRAGAGHEPYAGRPTPGSADVCLLPAGPLRSVDVRDRDGNPVERGEPA